jgi:DNA-binding MarR family transcriptional regulator
MNNDKNNALPKGPKLAVATDNIRRLMSCALEAIDDAISAKAEKTAIAGMRASEAMLLLKVAEGHETEVDAARELGITRQATYKFVQSLKKQGLLIVRDSPTDSRSKILVITNSGQERIAIGGRVLSSLESEIEALFGEAEFTEFKKKLVLLDQKFKPTRKRNRGLL